MLHKLNVTYNLFSSFIRFVFGVFFFFWREGIEGVISGRQIYLKGNK